MEFCYYYGSNGWPGHYLHAPWGERVPHPRILEYGPNHVHIDAALAPRRHKTTGVLCWRGQGERLEDRNRIQLESEEYPQGQFLLHYLDSGFTAIQWWDRNQGDPRGACNSTILLHGRHTADEMVEALKRHFPVVLEKLLRAGVVLVDVTPWVPRAMSIRTPVLIDENEKADFQGLLCEDCSHPHLLPLLGYPPRPCDMCGKEAFGVKGGWKSAYSTLCCRACATQHAMCPLCGKPTGRGKTP